ncbi:YceI family protein [Dyadobacter psychrotolerans]|uniref:Polyisoprenoid-binding protein n=1 Tax=Dyadobacter psychrotolerans TaxID=2541721 RepID=A0A4R5DJ20_9BACT|nr:YceI family protein [Dyadobacter psychrotolerans]TDE11970.1 polyisoprenoid-binding protein [Dyadobacter psychrotolerans]
MATTKWVVDPAHSEVQFKIKHLVISTITGSFNNFEGGATSDQNDFESAEIHFSLDVNSIDTNVEMRDNHLKSADFFDAEQFPHITFQSNYFHKVKGDNYKLSGLLTLKGITKPIELDAEYGGTERDAQGNIRIGFEVTGLLSRQEFGLNYMQLTDSGGMLIGEDVRLIANIQLMRHE